LRTGLSRCLLVVVASVAAAAAHAQVIDRVMAVVGSQVITLSDVRAAQAFDLAPAGTAADTTADVLMYLVNRELMLSEVDRYSAPEPAPAVIERRMTQIRARFPSSDQYELALARTAMTDQRLRSAIANTLRVETYLEQRFAAASQPTGDEVQRYYRDHPAEFTRNGRLAPLDEVQGQAQERMATERRRTLIADWLDRLRRRSSVTTLLTPEREPK
jgi:hypothetical protein